MEKSIKIEGGIRLNVNGDFWIDGDEKYFCADTPRQLLTKIGKYILNVRKPETTFINKVTIKS